MKLFRLLFFLLVITVPLLCRATDSLLNQSRFSTINNTHHQVYRAQLNSIDSFPLFQPASFDPSIKIPEYLRTFLGPKEIQPVCQQVFEKSESTFPNHIYTPGHELVFWKGTDSTQRYYGQQQWGLLRNENVSVWKKMGRAEKFIGGFEMTCLGILIMMPKEATKWPDDWMKNAARNIKRAFTSLPVMDKDHWQINYIGHPIAGALYYNSIRSQNATWFQSFLFSAAQSTLWEYVIEGIAEQPSIQDLIVTPIAGTMLGEVFHQLTMSMRRNGFSFGEKVVTFVINPMFVINNGFGPRHNPVHAR